MKNLFLTLIMFLPLTLFTGGDSFAYTNDTNNYNVVISPSLPNPGDYLKNNLLKNLPSNFKNFLPTNTATADNSLTNAKFSTSDIKGSLKSIAVLAINLFLIVIQTVAGILKALLPFLGN